MMKSGIPVLLMIKPLMAPTSTQASPKDGQDGGTPNLLESSPMVTPTRAGTNGQVDAAADDDHSHAHGDDQVDRTLLDDVEKLFTLRKAGLRKLKIMIKPNRAKPVPSSRFP